MSIIFLRAEYFILSAYRGIYDYYIYISHLFLIFCCGMAWMDMFDFGNENVCTFFKMQQKQMPL